MQLRLEGYTLDEDAPIPTDGQFALRPLDPSRPFKAVNVGVARLVQAIALGDAVPVAPVTGWVRSDVAAAVLDGLASLRIGSRRLSGVTALPDLFPALWAGEAAGGTLGRLSDRALAAGASHAGRRPLEDYLYAYGRLPVGDGELAELPNRAAVSRWLGIEPTPDWLEPWQQQDPRAAGWWNMWRLRDASRPIRSDQPVPKLYVSPRPADLPGVLREVCMSAVEVGIPTVKVGSDAHAVYRPDKLVAYAVDSAQLDALSALLQVRLSGTVAQGVPFTAELSVEGLLSWGVDPAPREGPDRQSWRQTTTIIAADGLRRATGRDVSTAVAMAKAWLWVHDIDPSSWSPVTP